MFKTETHLHTKPVSSCSLIGPREMIKLYKDAGYSTVFVSDHFARHHFKKLGEHLSWDELTDLFWNAYLEAKAAGDEFGINVLFSAELSLHGNHYLLYGIDKAFLKLRDDVFDMPLEDFYKHAKAYGVTIIQAHPYRDGLCTPQPGFVDGFEAINSNPRHENFDEKVFELAKKYNLPVSAGSDAHRLEDIAGAAMVSETEIKSVEEYLELLMGGKLRLMKGGRLV